MPADTVSQGLLEQWEGEFQPLLGKTGRWEGFKFLMADQLEREQPVILETGTLRQPGNWKGDGQSTRLWQWVVEHKKGLAISVDLDLRACELAAGECPNVHVVCRDSIEFMRGFLPFPLTLLYLDSLGMDAGGDPNNANWAVHQLAELTAIWNSLPSGCLIASDDSIDKDHGKPALTRRFLHILGIEPLIDGWIVAWRKP